MSLDDSSVFRLPVLVNLVESQCFNAEGRDCAPLLKGFGGALAHGVRAVPSAWETPRLAGLGSGLKACSSAAGRSPHAGAWEVGAPRGGRLGSEVPAGPGGVKHGLPQPFSVCRGTDYVLMSTSVPQDGQNDGRYSAPEPLETELGPSR